MELIRKKESITRLYENGEVSNNTTMISNISYWMEILMSAQPLSCPQGLP